ncbi:MAG: glycosyltransferase family 9 protein [Candidatus Omnitrophica bacterium]|nr:glycosyltransferase family 9 protein [Candidatus Omnitrophota bacterium]
MDGKNKKKVLIANIFGIGDVLFSTPLVANIKKNMPGVSVDYLCNKRVKDMVKMVPGVDKVIVYEKDDYVSLWQRSKKAFFSEVAGLMREIKTGRYDVVIDLTMSRKFGFLFFLSGIKERLGLDYRKRGLFLTRKITIEGFKDKHVTEHYLDILGLMGITPSENVTRIVPDEEALKGAEEYLVEKGRGKGPLVAVIPGGGASWGAQAARKRWPPKEFAIVADMLAAEGCDIIILGDRAEAGLCFYLAGLMRSIPLAVDNALELRDYASLLASCDLVLCNDGGPLHMAVAAGTATVSIFGPVDEKIYGPFPQSGHHKVMTARNVDCRPCYKNFRLPECVSGQECLLALEPGDVFDACMSLIKGKNA